MSPAELDVLESVILEGGEKAPSSPEFSAKKPQSINIIEASPQAPDQIPAPTMQQVGITTNIPLTEQAVEQTKDLGTQYRELISSYGKPGVPQDLDEGADLLTRAFGSLRGTSELPKYLENKFPGMVTPVEGTGNYLIRVKDKNTGKDKQILYDALGFDAGDIPDFIGSIPELGGAILGAYLTRGSGALWKQALGSAVGQEIAGTIQEDFTKILDLEEKTFRKAWEIHKDTSAKRLLETGLMTGANMILPGMGVGISKTSDIVKSPLGLRSTALSENTIQAAKDLHSSTGIAVPLNIAEQTGSKFFARLQNFARAVSPESKLAKMAQAAEDSIVFIQNHLMGDSRKVSLAEIGEGAIAPIRATKEATEQAAVATREAAGKTAENFYKSKISPIDTAPDAVTLGSNWMDSAKNKLAAFKANNEATYNQFNTAKFTDKSGNEFLGSDAPIASLKLSGDIAKKIEKSLPTGQVVLKEEAPSTILTAEGKPAGITPAEMGTAPLKTFSDRLLPILNDIKNATEKQTIPQVKRMRQNLFDLMASMETFPGVLKKDLSDLARSLTISLEKAADDPIAKSNPEAIKWLRQGNKQFKDGFSQFEERGITNLLKESTDPGSEGSVLVQQAINNPEVFTRIEKFFGKNSPQIKGLVDNVRQSTIDSAKTLEDDVLDAKQLYNTIFKTMNPTVAKNVFGDSLPAIRANLQIAELAKKGGKLNEAEVKAAMDNPTDAAKILRRSMQIQENLDKTYSNRVLKPFLNGQSSDDAIKPSEFVSRAWEQSTPGELKEIRDMLEIHAPEKLDSIQRKMFEYIFDKTGRSPTAEDQLKIVKGTGLPPIDPARFVEFFKNKDNVAKLDIFFGEKGREDLKSLLSVQIGRNEAEGIGKGAGTLVQSNIFALIVSLEGWKTIPKRLGYKAVSALLNSPNMFNYLTKTYKPTDTSGIKTAVLTSQPFLFQLMQEFKDDPDGLSQVIGVLKSEIQGGEPKQFDWDSYEKSLKQ